MQFKKQERESIGLDRRSPDDHAVAASMWQGARRMPQGQQEQRAEGRRPLVDALLEPARLPGLAQLGVLDRHQRRRLCCRRSSLACDERRSSCSGCRRGSTPATPGATCPPGGGRGAIGEQQAVAAARAREPPACEGVGDRRASCQRRVVPSVGSSERRGAPSSSAS